MNDIWYMKSFYNLEVELKYNDSWLRYKISYIYILYKEQKINLKIEMNEAASAVLHIYTSFWDNAQF